MVWSHLSHIKIPREKTISIMKQQQLTFEDLIKFEGTYHDISCCILKVEMKLLCVGLRFRVLESWSLGVLHPRERLLSAFMQHSRCCVGGVLS